MAQEIGVMMDDAAPPGVALATVPGTSPSRRPGYRLAAMYGDTEEQQPTDETEPGQLEIPEEEEAEETETPVVGEPVQGQQAIARVKALLTEALRLGVQYHLIEKQPDGALLLAGQVRQSRRDSSDCTCQQCSPHSQQHWICVVCHSGPHDWLMVKPQYERQALKAGGIEGTRHATCSAQCARDYLQGLGRQPSGVPLARGIDPTLALPG